MATKTISIKSISAAHLASRPTAIKVVTGSDVTIPTLNIYAPDDTLMSTLTNVQSGVSYCIMDGIATQAGVPEWIVPAPVYALDFIYDSDVSTVVVTGISFGVNVTTETGAVKIKEVTDSRLTGNSGDPIVVGGTGAVIVGTSVELETVSNIGDYYPVIGLNRNSNKIDLGVINSNNAKRISGRA